MGRSRLKGLLIKKNHIDMCGGGADRLQSTSVFYWRTFATTQHGTHACEVAFISILLCFDPH